MELFVKSAKHYAEFCYNSEGNFSKINQWTWSFKHRKFPTNPCYLTKRRTALLLVLWLTHVRRDSDLWRTEPCRSRHLGGKTKSCFLDNAVSLYPSWTLPLCGRHLEAKTEALCPELDDKLQENEIQIFMATWHNTWQLFLSLFLQFLWFTHI